MPFIELRNSLINFSRRRSQKSRHSQNSQKSQKSRKLSIKTPSFLPYKISSKLSSKIKNSSKQPETTQYEDEDKLIDLLNNLYESKSPELMNFFKQEIERQIDLIKSKHLNIKH